MSLPTDLHREIAALAEPPGFDAVVERARAARLRRRTTIASGLTAVVVAGGLALALAGPGDRSAEPAPPAPTTTRDGIAEVDATLPADVRAVLDDDRLDLWAVAGSSDALAVLWRGCDQEPCRFAVVTGDGDEVAGTALGASFPRLTAVPGGWLVEDATGTFRLGPSGERTQIYVTGPGNADVTPGDTAVETSGGWRLLRGDTLIGVPIPRDDPTTLWGAYATDAGRLVVATEWGAGSFEVTASDDSGASWTAGLTRPAGDGTAAALLAGNGDHLAVAFLGDDPDGSIPVIEVQVSSDAGATWTPARGLDTDGADRIRDLSSLAVAPSGTTYLTTGSHGLVRIDADGNARTTPLSSFDSAVLAAGEQVCVVVEAGRVDAIRCSADDGATWAPQPLPGFG